MAETEQLRKMFVGGLNWETDEDSLRKYFSQWGNIIDCIIMLKPDKTSRGFGFVTFDKAKCVDDCLKVRKHELDGRQIEPKRAVPKDEVNNPSVYQKTKKIFVGGLASTTTEEDIDEYFNKLLSEFGEGKIVDIELKRDRETNRIRGFAYVTFDSDEVVEKMVSMRNHEIKMKHCDVKKAESQAQLRRKQEQDGNYRPKYSSYQGSASRERSSNSNSINITPGQQNMAGFGLGNWGPGFFGGYFGGGVPGQGGFGGQGRGSSSDSSGRGQGGFSGSGSSSSGGSAGNWGLGNWGNAAANFGAGPMGFPGFAPGFGGFGGFPFGFGGMGYGPGFGAGYGAGFGYGGFGPGSSGASSGSGMNAAVYGSGGSGGGSSSYASGGSGPASYGKSDGDASSSYSSSDRATAGTASAVAGRDGSSAYGYGFGYGGPGMVNQQDWSSLAGFAGYGNYPGMVGGGAGDSKAVTMGTTATVDPYQLGSYNQANSTYGPTARSAASRTATTDVAKRVFRPY